MTDIAVPTHARRSGPRSLVSLVLIGGALLAVTAALPTPWRAVSLPFALLVPGFALCTALVGPDRPEAWPTRVLLWIATSLASTTVVGLVLALPRLELTRVTVLASQAVVILGSVATMSLRSVDREGVSEPGSAPSMQRRAQMAPTVKFASLAIAATVLILGIYVAARRPAVQFVAFRLEGVQPEAPLATPDGTATLDLVLTNNTAEVHTYRFDAGVDGVDETWAAVEAQVGAGDTWRGSVTGPVPVSGCLQRISVGLTVDGTVSEADPVTRWVAAKPGMVCEPATATTTTPSVPSAEPPATDAPAAPPAQP